ncbi:hypothetical protein AB1L42_03200 [Thalassoglobus sp. JC818]|uniref:hypothetical protein n=1 Tax=Thalassoglobus sp. JC818 TaxID=3232136 RepID=UPI003459E889
MEPLNILGVMVLIGFVLWSIHRSRNAVLTLVIDNNKLTESAGISDRCASEIDQFVRQDLEVSTRVTVRGYRAPQGGIRYEIRGANLDAGTEQQIRNFLKQVVCIPTRC